MNNNKGHQKPPILKKKYIYIVSKIVIIRVLINTFLSQNFNHFSVILFSLRLSTGREGNVYKCHGWDGSNPSWRLMGSLEQDH